MGNRQTSKDVLVALSRKTSIARKKLICLNPILGLVNICRLSEKRLKPRSCYATVACWDRSNLRSMKKRPTGSNKGMSRDRKSTRLNSSHQIISYAVFCLKKKKRNQSHTVRHHQTRQRQPA